MSETNQNAGAKFEQISKATSQTHSNQEEHGKFACDKCSELSFNTEFKDKFIKYQSNHNMEEVVRKLTQGMDDISIEYVSHHELLLGLLGLQNSVLVNNDIFWTAEDQKLFQLYYEKKNSNSSNSLINMVYPEWSQEIVFKYALYDAEQIVPNIFSKINGKAIIDGGGYIGDTAILWRMLFSKSKVHVFEPMTENFNRMLTLLKKDLEQENVFAIKKALGQKADTLKLFTPASDQYKDRNIPSSASTIKFTLQTKQTEEVEVITLDSYVEEHNLEVGLIKLDVEGFAPEVIQGAVNTIKTQRPILVIACYHSPEEFYEIKPFLESLNLNYRFEIRHSSLGNPLYELCLIAYPLS